MTQGCVCVCVFKDQGLGLGSVFKDLPILPAQVTPPALGLGILQKQELKSSETAARAKESCDVEDPML